MSEDLRNLDSKLDEPPQREEIPNAPSNMVECSDLVLVGAKRAHESSDSNKDQLTNDLPNNGEDG